MLKHLPGVVEMEVGAALFLNSMCIPHSKYILRISKSITDTDMGKY